MDESRGRAARLERLRTDRGKKHGIEAERLLGSTRHRQMAQVGRIKAAAEEGYAARAGRRLAGEIVHGVHVSLRGKVW
jgi:hypothetical protein